MKRWKVFTIIVVTLLLSGCSFWDESCGCLPEQEKKQEQSQPQDRV